MSFSNSKYAKSPFGHTIAMPNRSPLLKSHITPQTEADSAQTFCLNMTDEEQNTSLEAMTTKLRVDDIFGEAFDPEIAVGQLDQMMHEMEQVIKHRLMQEMAQGQHVDPLPVTSVSERQGCRHHRMTCPWCDKE